jgi:hypothetical protein
MNRTSKQIFRVAALACAAVCFNRAAHRAGGRHDKPVATLYSPTTSAAVSAKPKYHPLAERVPALLASDKTVTVTPDGTTYYTHMLRKRKDSQRFLGPWYVAYDLSKFLNGGRADVANGTTYTVAAQAGRFRTPRPTRAKP